MSHLRNLIIALFAALAVYTLFAIGNEGLNFLPGFLADLGALTWRGQVNLDLLTFTTLAGLWVAWRHGFSLGGLVLGVVVLCGAMLLFAPYLIYAIGRSKGDAATFFVGGARAGR